MIKFRIEGGITPSNKYGSIGIDLHCPHDVFFRRQTIIKMGVFIDDLSDYWLLIANKSGMGARGFQVLGGVIDPDYRGELGVILCQLNPLQWVKGVKIQKGQAIAQIIIMPAIMPHHVYPLNTIGNHRGEDGGLWRVN